MALKVLPFIGFLLPAVLSAQEMPELRQILDRLERLENENRQLIDEVRALRRDLEAARPAPPAAETAAVTPPAPAASLDERVAVQESRVEELAQDKVDAGQKLPVTLTGTLLFNAFWNGSHGGADTQYPITAQPAAARRNAGGTLRQSVIALRFDGPEVAGGKVSGTLYTDLWGGSSSSLNHLIRLRTATIQIDWRDTSIMVGQDKPIVAPREPTSLAQVGVSPLTAAGNLWYWQPQVRFEQRFHFGDNAGLNARAGVYQTVESSATTDPEYAPGISSSRPGLEGRFEFWKNFAGGRRFEMAPGFHYSRTRGPQISVPSSILTADWLFRPWRFLDFTGAFFHGQNVAVLGSLRQGIAFLGRSPHAVRSTGGWGQVALHATSRLTFNLFSGQQDDLNRDLLPGFVAKNMANGGNAMYRLGPNVVAAFEAAQARTTYLGSGTRAVNHYDLGLAYLF